MSDPTERADKTIDGGLYIDEHDFWINAEGEFVDKDGKKVDKPVKAHAPKPDSRPVVEDAGKHEAPKPFTARPTEK